MKIKELIKKLSEYDPEARIVATWEGQTCYFDLYESRDGTILIDADDNFYKDKFVSGEKKIDLYDHSNC